jgi:hypothetical protein
VVTIAQLRGLQNCTVVLRLTDGEVLMSRINFVDLEYEDIVIDVLETNRPEQYKGPKNSAYAIKAEDIASIERIMA